MWFLLETEIKLRVNNLDDVEKKLLSIGAKLVDFVEETDYYIDLRPCIDLRSLDMALRVRVSRNILNGSVKCELTFKGSRVSSYPKIRKEVSVNIDNAENLLEIFKGLGFNKVYAVSKTRKVYQFENFLVFLDNVAELGSFVEVETRNVTGQSISELANALRSFLLYAGIAGEVVEKTYLELLLEKKGLG